MYHLPNTALGFLLLVSSCSKNQNPLHDWRVDPISHLTSSPTSQYLPLSSHAAPALFIPPRPQWPFQPGLWWETPPHPLIRIHMCSTCFSWFTLAFHCNLRRETSPEPPVLGMSKFLICPLSSTYHHHHPMLTVEFLFQICLPCKSVNSMMVQTSAVLCLHH